MTDRMNRAYQAATRIIQEEMSAEDRALLGRVAESDVVVLRGQYDRGEDVLSVLGIPFQLTEPAALDHVHLRPHQMLVINCPGHLSRLGITRVREFVEDGGTLFTTDWALRHVLEPAFPGLLAYNERPTADEVVRIEIADPDSAILQGVLHEGADPLWWLEGSSYPIRILAPERVHVLLTSKELGDKYGEAPIAVTFTEGRGEVFHMISHYYLQRAETRTERHKGNWKVYAEEVGSAAAACSAPPELSDLTVGEVEAAHKSARFIQNIVVEKQKKRCAGNPRATIMA